MTSIRRLSRIFKKIHEERDRKNGRTGTKRGKENERRLVASFEQYQGTLPSWFFAIYPATQEEDESGADAVIDTQDVGRLYLQVKSSQSGVRKFYKRRRKKMIGVIVISDKQSNDDIVHVALSILESLRAKLLERRTASLEEEGKMATCKTCNGAGVNETGNNNLPCDDCPAGDTALFNIAEVEGLVTGAEVRRHFLNSSPEPITFRWPPIHAEDLPGRKK